MNSLKFKGTTKDRLDRIEKILEYSVMREDIIEKIKGTFYSRSLEASSEIDNNILYRNNLMRRLTILRNEVMGFFPAIVSKKK